jgi:hypothetical protein
VSLASGSSSQPSRPGGFGDKPAAWIRGLAAARGDLEIETIDLRDYPIPLEAPPKAAWSRREDTEIMASRFLHWS